MRVMVIARPSPLDANSKAKWTVRDSVLYGELGLGKSAQAKIHLSEPVVVAGSGQLFILSVFGAD